MPIGILFSLSSVLPTRGAFRTVYIAVTYNHRRLALLVVVPNKTAFLELSSTVHSIVINRAAIVGGDRTHLPLDCSRP